MTVWDSAFESAPAGSANASTGDASIRELKTAISEREDLEHNFKDGTKPFHKPGKCGVMYKGTSAQIDALTEVSSGCLAYSTDDDVIKVYDAATSTWKILDFKHSDLANLVYEDEVEGEPLEEVDDHPQYLKLNKLGQNIAADVVSLGSNIICLDGIDPNRVGMFALVILYFYSPEGFQARGGTYVENTVYGPVTCDTIVTASKTSAATLIGYIGTKDPPDIVMRGNISTGSGTAAISFIVPKGYYWKIYSSVASVTISAMEVF